MKQTTIRNLTIAAVLALGAAAVTVGAQMHGRGMMGGYYADEDGGYGPGMMQGYGRGYGPGMMGQYGRGYGPGMMQGYGPGMMMGPGMMGGYGPGMMMGPGMMGGYGPGMMGPGMMGGYGAPIDLSDAQREKIAGIQQDLIDGMWDHMRAMHQQMPDMWQAYRGEKVDVDEAMKAHESMMSAGRAMMRQRLEAHNAMMDVLTDEQREQLRQGYRRGRGPYGEDE
ncbi:Spy/CpxP family protein refolding chaperone [Ectothiorhodospiraceae bacterium WFHF3C12]|nr:Spy/CpxP family protein refolding chaperone [Ectothiorhodospiraceae bacterium WFHF3C12]